MRVVRRRHLDEIGRHEVHAVQPPDDLQRLCDRQPADLRRAGAGRHRRIEAVDVEAQIDGPVADALGHLAHQGAKAAVPAFLGLHDAEALAPAPVEIVGLVARAAQADLHNAAAVEQAFLDGAAKRRAMRDLLAEHRVVDVGVRVHVHQPHRPVALVQGAQDRQRDRMVAAKCDRAAAGGDDAVVGRGDQLDRIEQVVGVGRDVTDIGHLQRVERRRAGGHVVGPQQDRLGADLSRPEARAAAIGRAQVEGHAHEACVQAFGGLLVGQAHHRRDAGEARHLVAAERLIEAGALGAQVG